MRLEINY